MPAWLAVKEQVPTLINLRVEPSTVQTKELVGEGEIFILRACLAINASGSLCCADSAGGCRIACQRSTGEGAPSTDEGKSNSATS